MTRPVILVVEDEPVIACDLRQTLEELGYTVPTTVATGKQAIDTAELLRPQLILMDIQLKGAMDGVAAAKVIRDRFAIPVLYLTSHSSAVTRAALTLPQGFLVKPFCDHDLIGAIGVALAGRAVASGPPEPEVDHDERPSGVRRIGPAATGTDHVAGARS